MRRSTDNPQPPANAGKYFLSWKGKQTGPYTIEEIEAQLRNHEIGLMHEINAFGEWMPIEQFLARCQKNRDDEKELHQQEIERMQAAQNAQEESLRAEYEEKLEREYDQRERLQKRVTDLEETLRKQPALTNLHQGWRTDVGPQPTLTVQQRTSGLAITAFIMGLVNFIPFVNLVSWVLALIFGHVALSQIKNDPQIGGRGLAIAGLAITYSLLGIGLVIGFLYGFNSSTFYRYR